MRLLRPSSSLLVPSLAPAILIALIFGVIALLPIDGKGMEYVGLAYLLFFPVLVLLFVGFGLAVGSVFEAVEHGRGVLPGAVMLIVYAVPLCLMARQLLPR